VSSSIIVREALSEDLNRIVFLLNDDVFGQQREAESDLFAYKAAFNAILLDPNHSILVIEKDGELVGCVQVSYLPNLTFNGSWRAQFEGVRINRSHRGSGLGKRLINEAIARAKARGCRIIQLTTNAARPEAIAFYESLGFKGTHIGMKLQFN
jgi:ribosomal protein S18 acetylase RimI-like enzyme